MTSSFIMVGVISFPDNTLIWFVNTIVNSRYADSVYSVMKGEIKDKIYFTPIILEMKIVGTFNIQNEIYFYYIKTL